MAVSKYAVVMNDTHIVASVVVYDPANSHSYTDRTFVAVGDRSIAAGWTYDGTTFTAPAPDLGALKTAALSKLSDIRAVQEASFTYDSNTFDLTVETQNRIAAALLGMQSVVAADPTATPSVQWQVAPGTFITLDLAALTAFGLAAYNHVQGCFSNAKSLADQIVGAADAAALAAVNLMSGWS